MSKYIRVRGQLYQAVDAVNSKVLSHIMGLLKPELARLSQKGYVFSERTTAAGVDIYLHKSNTSSNAAEARGDAEFIRESLHSLDLKVKKIARLPFFEKRFEYDLRISHYEPHGRGPWHIMSIIVDQSFTGGEVLAKETQKAMIKGYTNPSTGLYEYNQPKLAEYKDYRIALSLSDLKDDLKSSGLVKIDKLRKYAKFIGRDDSQLAAKLNNFAKYIITTKQALLAEVSALDAKYNKSIKELVNGN